MDGILNFFDFFSALGMSFGELRDNEEGVEAFVFFSDYCYFYFSCLTEECLSLVDITFSLVFQRGII